MKGISSRSLGRVFRRHYCVASSLGDSLCSHSISFLLLLALPCAALSARQLKEARVSQIIHDVRLLPQQAAPRPAHVSDQVREGTAVRTGLESRAELTFTDATLARLGANTIFSFDQGTRNLELGGGAILLRVPKNSGGAQINTAAVTAAITGTTVMLEYHPNAFIKFIMLEGTGRIFRKGRVGESVLLHAGQMLIVNPKGKGLPDPVDVDLERLMKTSVLITGFPPLLSTDLIASEIALQTSEKRAGGLIDTNLVIFGQGTAVSLLDPTHTGILDQANSNAERQSIVAPSPSPSPTPPPITPTPPPITPTPTPSKFGTPSVISSPVPYVIGSGTVIQTDPSITTNGQTDFGKIYRGPTLDGSISTYLFTATSAFDNFLGFDPRFQVVDLLPLAVFKFSSLQLTGNPTVSLTNDGATNLALISVGDISSGPPGGTLTFAGLNSLIIATQNGSITLTSDLAFQDIPSLGFYARGEGSNLTLDSAISGTTNVFLGAEGSIIANEPLTITQVNSGVDLGLFTVIFAGENFTLGNSLSLVNDNSGGNDLANGGCILLTVGGDFSIAGDGSLTLNILNNGGSDLGVGGDIVVSTGGNLSAGSIDALINNRDGGSIDDGGNLSFDIGGALTTTGDAAFNISNRNDGSGGGTIGGGATIELSAANISVGGNLDVIINNLTVSSGAGGTINSDATINVGAASISTGAGGELFAGIGNTAGNIGGNASINFDISGNISTAGPLNSALINNDGGHIGGDALINFFASGDVNTQSGAFFQILNRILTSNITGDALVSVAATNITTGGLVQPLINNTNGSIGGDATVLVTVSGDINVGTDTLFDIFNSSGEIDGNATSTVSASNFSSGSTFEFQILNDNGSIGGDATLFVSLSGALTIGGDATIQIGNGGGSIGQDAIIDFNLGSFSANSLLLQIDNTAGIIGGTSDINFITNGDMTINGGALTATFANVGSSVGTGGDVSVVTGGMLTAGSITGLIDNSLGGSLGTGGNILITTGGDLVTTSGGTAFTINNSNDGTIDNGGNITLTAGGSLSTQGLDLLVANYGDVFGFSGTPVGQIGTGGNISVTTEGNLATDFVAAFIDNRNGASISSGATISFNIGGALTTQHDDPNFTIGLGDSLDLGISNRFDTTAGGTIGADATINLTAASVSAGGSLNAFISNNNLHMIGASGGNIGGSAVISFGVSGDLTVQGDAAFSIPTFGGVIASDAMINVNAVNISTNANPVNFTTGDLDGSISNNNGGGTIGSGANITFNLTGNLTTQGGARFTISNQSGIFGTTGGGVGGTIGSDATINVTAANLTADSLFVNINNRNEGRSGPGGMIGSSANLTFDLSGNLTIQTDATFFILNAFVGTIPVGGSGGTIGQDAILTLTANGLSIGGALLTTIGNERNVGDAGGIISGSAAINLAVTGAISALDDSQLITNSGGTIGSDATITVSAASLTITDTAAGALLALIDNGNGGVIGGNATINMNVSGNATVTSDATIEILGSDGAATAAINVNGGSYDAGGTFLTEIDGDGAITFSNASVHADVLKVGALGNNGTLTIGGGSLSGDTALKLYAGGSNGTIDFVANVSLSSLNDVAIIAANTITIENGVVVTTSGTDGVAASVFTNVPNYTGSGGNGTKTGIFAGDGAVTNPFNQAPPFDAPEAPEIPPTNSTTTPEPGAIVHHGPRLVPTIRVADSNELLDLVERVASGPIESGQGRSNAPAVAESVLSGTRRPSPGAGLAPTVRTFDRKGGRGPAARP